MMMKVVIMMIAMFMKIVIIITLIYASKPIDMSRRRIKIDDDYEDMVYDLIRAIGSEAARKNNKYHIDNSDDQILVFICTRLD